MLVHESRYPGGEREGGEAQERALQYAQYQQKLSTDLAKTGSGPEEDAQKWSAQVAADNAAIKEAQAEEQRSRLKYQSEIGGENTTVAATQAELDQALFYLENTLMVAPENGYIMNLQAQPGMVAGDIRFGAIASFICDDDRYLLANFFQENLKYVKPGQLVEAALDLYPGSDRRGQSPGDLAGKRCRSDVAERDIAKLQLHAGGDPARPVRRGNHPWTILISSSSRSALKVARRSTPILIAPSLCCARSPYAVYTWYNWLYPFSGSTRTPSFSSAVAVLAGCALKAPPTHTDVVEQALPKETSHPAGMEGGSDRRHRRRRLAEVAQRPAARCDRRRGDRQQSRSAPGSGASDNRAAIGGGSRRATLAEGRRGARRAHDERRGSRETTPT